MGPLKDPLSTEVPLRGVVGLTYLNTIFCSLKVGQNAELARSHVAATGERRTFEAASGKESCRRTFRFSEGPCRRRCLHSKLIPVQTNPPDSNPNLTKQTEQDEEKKKKIN